MISWFFRYKWETSFHTKNVVPEDLIDAWAGKNSSAEQAILASINGKDGLKETQKLVEEKMREMVKIQGELQEKALRNSPGVLSTYLNSLIESEKKKGADDEMINSLMAAKRNFDISAAGGQAKQREERDKKRVVNRIIEELDRRANLTKEQRLDEETKPSKFYNELHDLLPRHLKNNKAVPVKLEKSLLFGKYPPFKESLQRAGKLLRFLIRSWAPILYDEKSSNKGTEGDNHYEIDSKVSYERLLGTA